MGLCSVTSGVEQSSVQRATAASKVNRFCVIRKENENASCCSVRHQCTTALPARPHGRASWDLLLEHLCLCQMFASKRAPKSVQLSRQNEGKKMKSTQVCVPGGVCFEKRIGCSCNAGAGTRI